MKDPAPWSLLYENVYIKTAAYINLQRSTNVNLVKQ